MKKLYIFILILFIFSCGEKKESSYSKKIKPKQKIIENKNVEKQIEEKDPLLEAMELLTQYKKNPEDEELKLKVCDAFNELAKKAKENGNETMAKEYLKIASICNEEEIEETKIYIEKPQAEEMNSFLKVSLSNFDVQISGISKAPQADRVLVVLDEGYSTITSELAISLKNKIKVVLYTDKEFYDTTGFPPWIGGAYDGKIHLPLANTNPEDETFKKVIKHELTHAILHEATKGKCPTWLHEGMAQYFEGVGINNYGELSKSLDSGKIPPINSSSFLLGEKNKTLLLYQISLVALEFLKERGSMGSISNFIKKIGEGNNLEEAFYESFLFPYDELTERIKEYLKYKVKF